MSLTNRKKIVVLAVAVTLSALLLLASIPLIEWLFREPEPDYDFVFADPSLSADIYADEDYLDLDRTVYYSTSEGGYEFVTAIEESSYTSYDKAVQLLIKLVKAATAGDADAYNACFSPEYIKASGAFDDFTMQKIYDICIRKYALPSGTAVPEGYREVYVYGLSYKIKDNNGSLRNDMESDSSHEQFITVVLDKSGNALIYGVRVQNYRPA